MQPPPRRRIPWLWCRCQWEGSSLVHVRRQRKGARNMSQVRCAGSRRESYFGCSPLASNHLSWLRRVATDHEEQREPIDACLRRRLKERSVDPPARQLLRPLALQ